MVKFQKMSNPFLKYFFKSSFKIKLIAVAALFSATSIFAQYEFSFSGYVFDLPIYQSSSKSLSNYFGIKQNQFLNLSRVRLKPTFNLWSRARINWEYEISALYYSSPSGFDLTSGGKTNRQIIDLTWNLVNENNFTVNHFIDRLYFKQGFSFGEVEIGRQRVAWGSAKIWNPTDLFNPINPANFYKIEKDGADAVSFKYFIGLFTDLQVVLNPQDKLKESNYAFRFRTNYYTYDISFIGGYFDSRVISGLDITGNFFGAGLRFEGIISADENKFSSNFAKYIAGIDFQFTSELYTLLEFHFNGEGKKEKQNYQLQRLIKGEIINLSKNYLVASAAYQFTPLLNITMTGNINFNDSSGFLNLLAKYNVLENFDAGLGVQYFFGDGFTEYWYYSNSLYLQGDFYF